MTVSIMLGRSRTQVEREARFHCMGRSSSALNPATRANQLIKLIAERSELSSKLLQTSPAMKYLYHQLTLIMCLKHTLDQTAQKCQSLQDTHRFHAALSSNELIEMADLSA